MKAGACEAACGMKGPAAMNYAKTCAPALTVSQDVCDLFTEGDVLYRSMLASIASARSTVRLESYIFADDEVGRAFADALEVGTANLDYRSFFLNYELNLVSRSPELCDRLQAQFNEDLSQSREISSGAWPLRPFTERLSEAVGWAARRWL